VLLFNNPGQQFESRHLAVLRPLSSLKSLTLQVSRQHLSLCRRNISHSAGQQATSCTLQASRQRDSLYKAGGRITECCPAARDLTMACWAGATSSLQGHMQL